MSTRGVVLMENQPFDEEYDIEDQEDVASNLAVSPAFPSRASRGMNPRSVNRGETPPKSPLSEDMSGYDDEEQFNRQVLNTFFA